jgi:hypothetical protein
MFSFNALVAERSLKAIIQWQKLKDWYKYGCLYVVCRLFPQILEVEGSPQAEEVQLNEILDVSVTPHLNERCIAVPEAEFIGLISRLYMNRALSVGALCMLIIMTENQQIHGATSESAIELNIMFANGQTKTFDGLQVVKFV